MSTFTKKPKKIAIFTYSWEIFQALKSEDIHSFHWHNFALERFRLNSEVEEHFENLEDIQVHFFYRSMWAGDHFRVEDVDISSQILAQYDIVIDLTVADYFIKRWHWHRESLDSKLSEGGDHEVYGLQEAIDFLSEFTNLWGNAILPQVVDYARCTIQQYDKERYLSDFERAPGVYIGTKNLTKKISVAKKICVEKEKVWAMSAYQTGPHSYQKDREIVAGFTSQQDFSNSLLELRPDLHRHKSFDEVLYSQLLIKFYENVCSTQYQCYPIWQDQTVNGTGGLMCSLDGKKDGFFDSGQLRGWHLQLPLIGRRERIRYFREYAQRGFKFIIPKYRLIGMPWRLIGNGWYVCPDLEVFCTTVREHTKNIVNCLVE